MYQLAGFNLKHELRKDVTEGGKRIRRRGVPVISFTFNGAL